MFSHALVPLIQLRAGSNQGTDFLAEEGLLKDRVKSDSAENYEHSDVTG